MDNVNALQNVFSGADLVVIFGDSYIGECMSFTIGVNREAGPLYTMGRKEPIAIPYDALLEFYEEIMGKNNKRPIWVRNDEMVPQTETRRVDVTNYGADNVNFDTDGDITAINEFGLWEKLNRPNYVDQMPPFNVTVVGVNEQGEKMGFRIYGLSIINEGMAMSVDELNMEKRYTFIAQSMSRIQKLRTS